MGKKLKLVGCERYNFRGELYEKGKVYLVGDQKAELMLRAEDDFGRPYFAAYQKPLKSNVEKAAEAAALAAAAAVKAQEEAEVVDRPDGSEPKDSVPVEEVDEDAAVEVDTDDDPELDEDVDNPEAIEVDEEDRDDGTAVEV